ncbi:cupredoxin domain-containing protein [Paracraurococcus lichenis]|uniref:Plastocyanin/azurin family copper-binding protein n=1 Tax=Paracraurococcus lichenis TaxID=3064888 RepID=A0ABT9ECX1_9PROT|nr:plastocyanin/azurin family copper-binding protein [Paracraurococcus sp. LOR1-02]MDO9713921.1 plastocyanin/azurin family copper-binding protein [Paracraurococcus sp. LOR1-02]
MRNLSGPGRRKLLLASPFVLAAGPAGARHAMPAAAVAIEGDSAAISIDNFTFSPALITIGPGTRVVWTNRDDIPHTILGRDDPLTLRSPPLDTDDVFSFVFTAPGTYRYFCSLHPHMQGAVVVR